MGHIQVSGNVQNYRIKENWKFRKYKNLIKLDDKKHVGRRILAGLIDYTIFISITYFYVYIFGNKDDEGAFSVSGIKALPVLLFWILYFCLIETSLNATLGNYFLNLKPVDIKTENNVTFKQSFLRHLVDPIDMFFFGIVAIIIIKNSKESQRLGDLLGQTKVIKV